MQESFRYQTFPQEIVFGAGTLNNLATVVAERGWKRVMLVSTRSQGANGNIERIESLLGETLVAVFDSTQSHVPQANVDAAVKLALGNNADALFALGGGSAIGVAKATSYALQALISNLESHLPLLAIPTTYAGSEMTPVFGVTRERDGITKKETTNDPRILPRVVLYDPELTLDLPRELTASTGVNAFAHCVEAVYSVKRNPLSTLAALEGARLTFDALPSCIEDGRSMNARTNMLKGAYLAGAALANVAMGLHHGVCHVLGGTANVPHGIANAIILPYAIQFNADACAHELASLARVIGITPGSDREMAFALVERVRDWIARMALPTQLRDAGVKEQDLPKLAELAFANKTVQNNPKKIPDAGTLEEMLRGAW